MGQAQGRLFRYPMRGLAAGMEVGCRVQTVNST